MSNPDRKKAPDRVQTIHTNNLSGIAGIKEKIRENHFKSQFKPDYVVRFTDPSPPRAQSRR
jgi:hypothetical protein